METAKRVKEMHCYTCPDLAKEFLKYDASPEKYFRGYSATDRKTGRDWKCDGCRALAGRSAGFASSAGANVSWRRR